MISPLDSCRRTLQGHLTSYLSLILLAVFCMSPHIGRTSNRIRRATAAETEKAGADKTNKPRPNVLFIAVDDLNDWITPLGGHPQAKTPNLDRLAARGVVFTRAYCSAPACNPSRASLMTGRRPSTSGVYHNPLPWRLAMPNAVTISQHFMANGYAVGGAGKIFHGAFPDRASWQEYFRQPGDPKPKKLPVNGLPKTRHFDWGPVDVPDKKMGDAKVVNWAIEYLGRKHTKPFFLACGIYRPHLPWFVPNKYFAPHPEEDIELPVVKKGDLEDIPEAGRKMAKPQGDHRRVTQSGNWKKAVQGYLASIAFADAQIGRLLDALEKSDHAKDTIIVLWGDHGWHLGEKRHWRKFALWEEATRVPLLFVAPGVTKEKTRSGRTVSLLDLYPTLTELCDLPTNEKVEGRSIVPLLRSPDAEWNRPVVTTHGRGNHAVRSERWRYIRYADGSEELYDHDKDPNEWSNLAEKTTDEVAKAKAELAKWLPKKNVPTSPGAKQRKRK